MLSIGRTSRVRQGFAPTHRHDGRHNKKSRRRPIGHPDRVGCEHHQQTQCGASAENLDAPYGTIRSAAVGNSQWDVYFFGEFVSPVEPLMATSVERNVTFSRNVEQESHVPTADDQRIDKKFQEQLGFLARSCEMFDNGHEEEALRLATSLRVFLHDTRSSTSLLSHMGLNGIDVLSTSRGHGDWQDYLAHEIRPVSPSPVWVRPLLGNEFNAIPKADWWNVESVFSHGGESYTRRVIICSAANKDGGAHVDSKLEEYYEILCAGEYGPSLTVDPKGGGQYPFTTGVPHYAKNAHLGLIRQFAHEFLTTANHNGWCKK